MIGSMSFLLQTFLRCLRWAGWQSWTSVAQTLGSHAVISLGAYFMRGETPSGGNSHPTQHVAEVTVACMPCSCQCGAEGLSSFHVANASVHGQAARLQTPNSFAQKWLDEDPIVGNNSFKYAFSSVTWALDGSLAIFALVAWWRQRPG